MRNMLRMFGKRMFGKRMFGKRMFGKTGDEKPEKAEEPAVKIPVFTPEDAEELDRLEQERRNNTRKLKIETFLEYPAEVREKILDEVAKRDVRRAVIRIGNTHAQVSPRETDLMNKKYSPHQGAFYTIPNRQAFYGDEDEGDAINSMPSYEDLMRAHTDKVADKVLIENEEG